MQYQHANYELIQKHINKTPVVSNDAINADFDGRLYFKCENLQKTGSFKYRGAVHALLSLDKSQYQNGIVTVSSGNHGAALAKAGSQLDIKTHIIIPEDVVPVKLKNIQQYQPEIIFAEPGMPGRERALAEFFLHHSALYIPSYNHPDIILGQASCAYELAQTVPDLDYLIAPIGGGGLSSGCILAMQAISPTTKIIGAEPANADDAYRSLQAGKIIPQTLPDTICDGLKSQLGDITFAILTDGLEDIILVTEEETLSAMKFLLTTLKLLIEPSSATVFAAALKQKNQFRGKKVGLILSGGNVDLASYT